MASSLVYHGLIRAFLSLSWKKKMYLVQFWKTLTEYFGGIGKKVEVLLSIFCGTTISLKWKNYILMRAQWQNDKVYQRTYINWYNQLVMFTLQCQKDRLAGHCISWRFNLIFQKWLVNFLTKNYCKLHPKCWLQWLRENETFWLYIT